jgi:FkbM family methyltransferase
VSRFIQTCLLKIYAYVSRTGILSTSAGRALFLAAYNCYKLFVEARNVHALKSYVRPHEVVIDIGANVGFFTKRFARWVSGGGFVIAIEPETTNFERLKRSLETAGVASVTRTVQAVVAETCGTLKLSVNPTHPGDHKIASEGIDVAAVTIDHLVRKEQAKRVCLIKIDVQGAEERVLRGAQDTIQRDHPAIFIELDDAALNRMGSSATQVVNWLLGFGYSIQSLERGGKTAQITPAEALEMCRDGRYADLLFVADANCG